MRWRNRRQSTNVVKKSGGGRQALGGAGGGGIIFMLIRFLFAKFGIGAIVVLVGGFFALKAVGVDPIGLVMGGNTGAPASSQSEARLDQNASENEQFVAFVLGSTEDVWTQVFQSRGQNYKKPTLNLFTGGVTSGCGYASSATGPFYCPADQEIYLDLQFFDEMSRRFGAPGDFAQAYVIAHEVGHHIQTITGISAQVQRAKQNASKTQQNALQVRMELQADCLSGAWAYHEQKLFGSLEQGDIDEALAAANAIGDDTLQRQAGRRPMPDSFTHGTSEQRKNWFTKGWRSGDMDVCDTFSASAL
jgi:uncharacterized protein